MSRSSNYRKFDGSTKLNEAVDIEYEDRYQLYDQEQNYMNFDLLQQEIKTIWQLISQNNSQILVLQRRNDTSMAAQSDLEDIYRLLIDQIHQNILKDYDRQYFDQENVNDDEDQGTSDVQILQL